jgi:hypothetical protein
MSETELRAHAVRFKAGVSIARVIGEALLLKREGNLLVGLCPSTSTIIIASAVARMATCSIG